MSLQKDLSGSLLSSTDIQQDDEETDPAKARSQFWQIDSISCLHQPTTACQLIFNHILFNSFLSLASGQNYSLAPNVDRMLA
jgi:hypothetical protein